MFEKTLFGYLASRFTSQPENLATEALNYVINRSPTAKAALLRCIDPAGSQRDDELSFRTQVVEKDLARPDLVGFDAAGRHVVIIEAKFWAGLTDNQPITYLGLLPDDMTGSLLFIAPVQRMDTLWSELLRRCKDAGLSHDKSSGVGAAFRSAKIDQKGYLKLVSWRSLLAAIRRDVEAAGQEDIVSDISQLQGLCERMDEEAFLPLRSEELTGQTAARVLQYCQLVESVTGILVAEGIASIKGMRAISGVGSYGRYMTIDGCGCLLQFNARYWQQVGLTPLWLSVWDERFKFSQPVRDALRGLELEDPPRFFIINGQITIPVYLLTGVEQEQVVAALAGQVREVAGLLKARLRSAVVVAEDVAQPGNGAVEP